jgi:hypothetical protein
MILEVIMKSQNKSVPHIVLCFSFLISIATPASYAADAGALAKQSQNPISSLISVPFENNANFNAGPDDDVLNVMNIKPVIPISFSENWNLVNRAIVPLISQPGVDGTSIGRENGLGDITYQGFFTRKKSDGDWIIGFGPQIQLPTHSDDRLGNDRWAAGPAFVALSMPGPWVIGGLASQIWDFTSDREDDDISMFTLQPFVNYNFGKGWYVVSAPVITANWEAKGSDQWTVPFGGGVGRVVHIGKQAVNFRAAAYGNVLRPSDSSDYNIQFSATLLFPK